MTPQKPWKERFAEAFPGSQSFCHLTNVEKLLAFIETVEKEAYNEGYSHALHVCKILIVDPDKYGALRAIRILEDSLRPSPSNPKEE